MEKTNKFENMPTPDEIYDNIRSVEDMMEDDIHDLVYEYGKRTKSGNYELSLWNRKYGHCIITDASGKNIYIKKCIILTPEKCQVRGHLLLETSDKKQLGFVELNHQQWNVYSRVYRLVEILQSKAI